MGDHKDEKQEEEGTKRKITECSFLFPAVLGKETPAVNVDSLQAFKLDILPNLNALAGQDKQHHSLL